MNLKQPTVEVGSVVTIHREFRKPKTYKIWSYTDPMRNLLSAEHPLAKGVMNHKKGDTIRIDDPNGCYFVTIVDVDTPPLYK